MPCLKGKRTNNTNMATPITTTATTLEGQLYEIALAMLNAENNVPEANRPDNVQIDYSTEATSNVTITAALDTNIVLNGAEAQITVKPYLP